MALYAALSLDVVVAADTHAGLFEWTRMEPRLLAGGWRSFWCLGHQQSGQMRAGVAVLVRDSLLRCGKLQVRTEGATPGPSSSLATRGRLLRVPLRWGGQDLDLVGVYFHASDYQANVSIIESTLQEWCSAAPGGRVVALGDFNFVPCIAVDRGHVPQQQQQQQGAGPGGVGAREGEGNGGMQPPQQQQGPTAATRDTAPAAAWQRCMPGMRDVWREKHPRRRAYTYFHSRSFSRLDRVYVSTALMPQVASVKHADRQPSISDHTPVVMQLLPSGPGVLGPGLPKLRLSLQGDRQCEQQLAAWLTEQEAAMPADDLSVVGWWSGFKQRLRLKVQALNREARDRRANQGAEARRREAWAAVQASRQRLAHCSDGAAASAAVARLQADATALASLLTQEEAVMQQRRRQQWVHSGERPHPAMTKMLRPSQGATFIAGLHAPGSGHLVVDGVGLASIVGQRYAEISTAPQVQRAAQQVVLQAMAQHSKRLTPEQDEELGAPAVSAEEVAQAIQGTAQGKSPGVDGIPGELFRRYREQLAPILARLYSAIGATKQCPSGFLDGAVVPVLKPGGVATDVDAYRPIQLLNYDYRLMAKLLANRLLRVAGHIIDPAQSAFLQHRHIGDSVRLLQLLPQLLRARNQSAIAAFLDFRKAYDTVSRDFLFAAGATLGVGAGFVAWMKVLLTDTYTCAVVNGFQSSFYHCSAGVRQGCPLAPLMYLFAGQALLCHLRQRGIGIDVAAGRLVAAQYADDVETLLPGEEAVPGVVADLTVYGDATGQWVQPPKCQLLPLGRTLVGAAPVAGIRVSATCRSLGVIFGSMGVVGVDWEQRLGVVRDRVQKISRIPDLSMFGRAFAFNGYAISTLLYHAHFTGALPAEHAVQLIKWASALVDAGIGPEDDQRRAPGVPRACMEAHPREGGLGLLPVRAHLHSRLACEAVQVLVGDASKPWVAASRELLQHHVPVVPGGGYWGLALCGRRCLFREAGGRLLPDPLRAFALGIRALPYLRCVGSEPEPGPWCYHIPLWSNPLVAHREQWDWFGQQRQVMVGLEFVLPGLSGLGTLQCIGQGVHWLKIVEDLCTITGDPGARDEAYKMLVWEPVLQKRPRYTNMLAAREDLRVLVAAIPSAWQEAARAVLRARQMGRLPAVTDAQVAAAREKVCVGLGWETRDGEVVELSSLTVALATKCQSLDALSAIADRHDAFIRRVESCDALQPGLGRLPGVTRVLARWWKLRVPNEHKEAAWRLTLDGFPTARRMHTGRHCVACGVAEPGVEHHCWECPVAVAVRHEIEGQLRAHRVGGGTPWLTADSSLRCASLWLGVLPHPGLHRMVWDMVCLAGIGAMEYGRKVAWSAVLDQPALPLLAVERIAGRAAVGEFWRVLADFAVSAVVPRRVQGQSLTHQPFIAWHVVLAGGNGLRVVRH